MDHPHLVIDYGGDNDLIINMGTIMPTCMWTCI